MSTVKCTNVEALTGGGAPDNLLPITCSAWVNFNGTGTVAIRDSYNVSSITDLGVGLYQCNFAVALADVNYSCNVTNGTGANYGGTTTTATMLTGSVVANSFFASTGGVADATTMNVQVFGGQ